MKRAVFSIVSILLSLAIVPAQNAPRVEPGVVEGIVTRVGTNEPLPDVQVSLEGAVSQEAMKSLLGAAASSGIAISPPAGASLSETTQMLISAAAARGLPIQAQGIQNIVTRAVGTQTWPTVTADRDGRFVFRDVQPGRYTVRAVREGFFGKPVNGSYPPTAWDDIVLGEKETRQVALSMAPGAVVAGRVYDATGAAVSNVQVQVYSVAYQTGFTLLQPAIAGAAKTTDDRGEYRLFWIPPGDYYLGATPPGRTGGPGTPFQPGARTFYPSVTRMNEAIPITIRGGEDMRGMDIAMRTAPTFRISGTVTNTLPLPLNASGDGPMPVTVNFHLANRDLDTPNDSTTANQAGSISLAVASGPFDITNVSPGSYEVLARVSDPGAGTGLGAFAYGRAVVDVEDRDVSNVAITIYPAPPVQGTIRLAGGGTLPNNLRVSLSPMGGTSRVNLYTLTTARAAAIVAAAGSFSIPSVQPGRWRIGTVSALPQDFYIADVRQSAMSVFDTGFEVGSRVPDPIEIVISGGGGVVDGVVMDGPAKTAAGAVVALVPEPQRFENRTLFATAPSDASGRFVFRGISPGDYRLFAWESTPPNAYQSANFIRKYEGRALTVHIGQAGSAHVELAVIPANEKK